MRCAGLGLLLWAVLSPAWAAPSAVVLSCAVAYMPQRSTWVREVRIDGLEPYGFSLLSHGVMTAVDNERIQIDLSTRQWQSDFRGHAFGQGRCETVPG